MSNPRHSDPDRPNRRARAPYNFVPLPEKVARADQDLASLPTHDRYHAGRLTGQIECRLVTQSPLYTRRAVSPQWWARWTEQMDRLHLDDEAKRYYAEFFQVEADKPLIPGSSLRGMVRSVLEIIAHGHVRWVADQPAFTFRAVAAARTDPLSQPYDEIIGRFTRNVRAGYLNYDARRDAWSIQPALTPADLRLGGEQSSFLRVKEDDIERNAVRGFRRLNNPNYRPGFYPVRFNVEPMSRGVRVVQLRSYDERDTARKYAGVLVCSGNMKETTDDKPSPRKHHALILAPNRNQQPIPIEPEVIRAYKASLTDFQREQLTDWNEDGSFGCLGDGKPVFFVTEAKRDGRGQRQEYVRWFGHTPNFRVPARLQVSGQERASTPLDFVPTALRTGDEPDLVEAIFGWVEDGITSLKGQRAGRVSFSDARFVAAQNGLWLQESPVALHTLSSPKPTTFQHYLVQDREHQHNPDQLSSLAHYGTSPTETQIRGYKRYWHKGPTPDLAATDKERQHSDQLTYVRPLKPGVEFNFTIRFENLSDVELGALLWALALPGEAGRHYYHKLGMGKPLGMGAVALTPTLTVDDRTARYRQLLAGDQWHQPS
ncbi:MAG: TIGR03986 family CRISPR-associated RAMP protein, partial [Chloroflexi bacterium]